MVAEAPNPMSAYSPLPGRVTSPESSFAPPFQNDYEGRPSGTWTR